MIRYFFDIRDGTGLYPDEEGFVFQAQQSRFAPKKNGRVFQAALIFDANKTRQWSVRRTTRRSLRNRLTALNAIGFGCW